MIRLKGVVRKVRIMMNKEMSTSTNFITKINFKNLTDQFISFFENETNNKTIKDGFDSYKLWNRLDRAIMSIGTDINTRIIFYAFLMGCSFELENDLELNNRFRKKGYHIDCIDIWYPEVSEVEKNFLKLWPYRHNFKKLKHKVSIEILEWKNEEYEEYIEKYIPAFHR